MDFSVRIKLSYVILDVYQSRDKSFIKVRLTTNMIFGTCNIWVIRRRNVYTFIIKNPIMINFFTVKVSGYDVIRWIANFSFPLFLIKAGWGSTFLAIVTSMMLVMLLWVYIHSGQAWKTCPATVRIEPTTFGIQAQCSANWATWSGRFEHWASIPKVVGSIPTVAGHVFQACPLWIYTQSNITSKKSHLDQLFHCQSFRIWCH